MFMLGYGKKKSSCEYVLSPHVIEQVDSMKDIEVTIDLNLTFNEHINIKIDKIVDIITPSPSPKIA